MSHNLVITKPGAREEVVKAGLNLAEKGPAMNFVPETDAVLWSIPVLAPGESRSITFTAPQKTGTYPYVCTYPGHGFVMYGDMYVTDKDTTTAVKKQTDTAKNITQPHPYALTPPYLYHAYVDGASPAAIAVRLPNEISYCWDAGECRLRFAWKGGFIDMSDLWKGHFNASAKILGNIFFHDDTDFPFRIGESAMIPTTKYKGYALKKGYPEFHYTLNGTDVYELIQPDTAGTGLIRTIRVPNADRAISFYTNAADDAIEYTFSAGKLVNNRLRLTPAEAKSFTITMKSYFLAYQHKKK
jgi:hypothetical protein